MLSIKVSLEDLLEKLHDMKEDDCSTVEIEFEEAMIEEDSYIRMFAFDPINCCRTEYGDIPYDDGEL